MYPLLFNQNIFNLVWGSENWIVSAVPDKESTVANGSLNGATLGQLVYECGVNLMGKKVVDMYGNQFPLLIKFIDAKQDLSIQVHPNDELAMQRHGSFGKTEMWFVIDAEPGAKLYSGFNQAITKYEYQKRVEDGSICEVLQSHSVKKGDVFFIPAGRIHAICGGIYLAEVQQSSDITYRIFDYKRPGLDGRMRQLHTELAVDAIDYRLYPTYKTRYIEKTNKPVGITQCPYFTVKIHNITRAFHRKLFKYDSFIIYICLEGDCVVSMRDRTLEVTGIELKQGQSCLVPASVANLDLIPNNDAGVARLLEVYIDNRHFNQM